MASTTSTARITTTGSFPISHALHHRPKSLTPFLCQLYYQNLSSCKISKKCGRVVCKATEVSVAEGSSPASDGRNWVPVVPLSALPKGERRVIIQDGETILLLWYKDSVYAIENRSPAEGAYSEGLLNAKLTQMLSHHLFTQARYSIWVDSKSQFRRDPLGVLEALLWRTNSVLAMSEHGARSSVYDEGKAVVRKHKATPEKVEVQLSQYRRDGFPDVCDED